MEMVIFIGAQASGKSSFFCERFSDTHVRINLDMLKTRSRELILVNACLEASQNFVIDNTNPTTEERARYFRFAASFRDVVVRGFYFQSGIRDCIGRNRGRAVHSIVPDQAIVATVQKLELPQFEEGFDQLHFVSLAEAGFIVEGWNDEL